MKNVLLSAAGAALALVPVSANAQAVAMPNAASLALGKCLVGKSNGEDRILVARWMGASIAMSPAMADVVTVDADKKDAIDREMAATFTRLMTVDCQAEMGALVKARDAMGIQAASGMLGQMAMQELLRDPATMQALMAHAKYIDQSAMQKLTQ